MTKSKGIIIIRDPVERFWKFADKKSDKECWEWTGRKNYKGYGDMKIQNNHILAHRYSYEINIDTIPKSTCVLHHCDNPACVNPSHLFLGSIQDNNMDRDEKGRKALGEKNGRSKLTLDQVKKIKHFIFIGKSDSELARQFRVWHTTIRAIRIGTTWSHV